jgi:hypothetical protein
LVAQAHHAIQAWRTTKSELNQPKNPLIIHHEAGAARNIDLWIFVDRLLRRPCRMKAVKTKICLIQLLKATSTRTFHPFSVQYYI